ncbi:outer membrane protein assembly factor BamA [Blochmannia endosymbiont of Camponotus sp.]|uniref:outer membrane protein assembly factor BamA n=1 Tax=Blochmannia endosymbiont of Camponotus sp. TaxID=700220 RepID=UPI0020259E24|nr:outer membrane protein assembly factor BamA [Blochmannia endosymbiont of Camponotus sp.]URJ24188.1 outer membrane protein assembly factor BamA [Blochmannia endosymbiont of Camponotus sp.]URJ25621.1 outer membrane protein assembly factor BamA [Blochmannia endosymbiont of Camponotus sp.]
MKKIFIAFLLIISNVAHSADTTISKILFNGLKRIALDTVLFNLPLKIGAIINDEDIANSIKVLFSTGYFEEITISNNEKGIIIIQVKERPVIDNVNFHGNKIITEDVIKKTLNAKKIQSGEPFNECSIFELKRELDNLYHNFGKFTATTKIAVIPLSRNRVNLKIIFTEGKTAKVQQINIFGNHAFHTKKLLSQFKLYRKIKWRPILSNRQYQQQKLFHDLEKLSNFYLNHGYAKFHIDETQIDLTPNKKYIYLSLYINEGMQYTFDSVKLHGNILDYFPNIEEYMRISPGELYSNNKIQEIERNIRYVLSKHGYMQPIISIEPDINDNNKTIKLYVYVDIGRHFYVREVRFEGNNITKDEVIRREIHQTEQMQLDYTRIVQDQDRLKRLCYFKTVNTRIAYVSDTLNQIDVIYKVEERNTGNLNLSVGFGTESGINLQFGMYQENVLGSGNSIAVASTKNHYQTYAEISSVKPYCGVNNISVGGKIFFNDLNTNKTGLSDYNLKNCGININCSYPIIEYNTFNIGLNYISNYLSKVAPQVAIWRYLKSTKIHPKMSINNKFLDDTINFHTNDFLLVSGWTFDNLNHAYFPTYGVRANLSSTLTLPGSNNQYYKILINCNSYMPFGQYYNWIIMNSIYAGYCGSIHKKENPFYDNFYAGGIGTIRGFRLNSIGPKAAYYHCNDSSQNYTTCAIKNSQDAVGGNAITLFKTELIIPITYFNIQHSDIVRISLFLDTGTVWDTFWKNTEATQKAGIVDYSIPSNIRISSGIALKWVSPVGPVIFSYSKSIKKYLGDIEEPFQFSIGKTW